MFKSKKIIVFIFTALALIIFSSNLYAQTGEPEQDIVASMVNFIFQVSVIIFAAKVGGAVFEKFKLPAVLGEIVAGVIIGPYLLGNIPIIGFNQGLFPFKEGFPVSGEIYGIATIASIMLLFLVGLETNIETLFSFSVTGLTVGLGGVIASFLLGDLTCVLFSEYIFGVHYGFGHPVSLFLGIISTATSVGITARILTEKKKMDSPEGVTIVIAAVIDDILGIIALAIVISIVKSGNISWNHIIAVSLKAIGIWLGFTAIGLYFSRYFGEFLKKFKDRATIAVMSFAFALFLAGIFERSGLAMIVGAYVAGLSFSKTDLSFVIRENLAVLYRFFVPFFFCVMGMLVNFREIFSVKVIIFGLIYVIFAVLGKVAGCGFPALFSGFNLRGALRVGVGMIPRGEVALIIAGIGLSSGILIGEMFSVAIFMTFITTLLTPPILDRMLQSKEPAMKKKRHVKTELKEIIYDMPNPETAELILSKVIAAFEAEGFYVHLVSIDDKIYQILKGQTFITMKFHPDKITFNCSGKDAAFIYTLFYEVIAEIEHLMKQLGTLTNKEDIGKRIFTGENGVNLKKIKIEEFVSSLSVEVNLKGNTKPEIIEELIDILIRSGRLKSSKRKVALVDLLEREATMSTGMQDGIALPHAKTNAVNSLVCAIGLKKEGVEFNSLDKTPSKIFILTLSPKWAQESYLQFMAEVSKFLINKDSCRKILSSKTNKELYEVIVNII